MGVAPQDGGKKYTEFSLKHLRRLVFGCHLDTAPRIRVSERQSRSATYGRS
jgi:hypothetical protein